jgi:TetR/AcrR family transcriptional regulator
MPVRGLTKHDVIADFRRAELVHAANTVFARKGFAGASVEEIAKVAGVAKGTVYLYYPSKHDIYWAALESGIVALDRSVRAAVETCERSLHAQLLAIARTKLAYFDERRDFFRIFFSELGSQACEVSTHPRLRPLYLEQVHFVETLIDEAVSRGEIARCEPRRVAFAIADLARGVVRRRLLEPALTSIDEDAAFIVDLLWNGVGGKAPTKRSPARHVRPERPTRPLESPRVVTHAARRRGQHKERS